METIDEKISFKKHIKIHRCVTVADGFYEWKRDGKEKTPFYFMRDDKKMIFIAGIFADNQFCLITEQASVNVSKIHERQPVILNEKDINDYLNLQIDGSTFLKEANKPNLEFYEISKDVNKPTNNNISLIQKLIELFDNIFKSFYLSDFKNNCFV